MSLAPIAAVTVDRAVAGATGPELLVTDVRVYATGTMADDVRCAWNVRTNPLAEAVAATKAIGATTTMNRLLMGIPFALVVNGQWATVK